MLLKVARFEIIYELKGKYPVSWLVLIAKVSRSGYDKWEATREMRAERQKQEHLLREKIMMIHQKRPSFGYPRVQIALKKEGIYVNHKRVYRLMKEMEIASIIRKKRRYFGRTPSVIHPNHVNRQFEKEMPN